MLMLLSLLMACHSDPTGPGGAGPPAGSGGNSGGGGGGGSSSPPAAPTGVAASTSHHDDIGVYWNPVAGASGYKIYRSTGGSSYSYVGTSSTSPWLDRSAVVALYYSYKVAAYSAGGESQQSGAVYGYRMGWRFGNVAVYKPTGVNGIGLTYDLFAFGYRNWSERGSIFAIYYDGSVYRYIPGSGAFSSVAETYLFTPPSNEQAWNGSWYLPDAMWNSNYRNNTHPEYLAMKIYKTQNIQSLNDPTFTETSYYRIGWTGSTAGAKPVVLEKLSPEQCASIDRSLRSATGVFGQMESSGSKLQSHIAMSNSRE